MTVRASTLPLAGVRVLDLSRYLPGPYLTRVLADLGAEVFKVEGLDGDPMRYLPPLAGGVGATFAALNFGKRALALDLKQAEGVAVLRRACAAVDVVVESFRPGVLDRLGLGFASLSADNPRLILCSISGFGAGGPLAQRAGHDLTYLARIGLLSLLAPPGAAPRVPGVQLADIGGGALAAAVSLLSALFARERDGRGRHLDVAMARGLVPFTALAAAQVAAAGSRAAEEDPLRGTRPAYRLYPTRDGRHMALAALEPKFFQRFCEVAGCSHLTGSGLTVGAEGAAVTAELERVFAARTLADWTTLLAGTDCCCEPVQTAAEATADTELGLASVDADGLRCLASPWHSADLPTQGHVPALGEHGREVARELGVDDALIEAALAAGAMLPGRERGGAAP